MEDETLPAIVTLHKYFIWSNRMRTHFDEILEASKKEQEKKKFDIESLMYLSLWYATLYTVIEGWKELKLQDPKIDFFLQSPNVENLKKYRNGVLHFQRNYFDQRFLGMITSQDSVSWVRELNSEFGRYFLDWYREQRDQQGQEVRKQT